MLRPIVIALAGAAALPTAAADAAATPPRSVVSYAGLDLAGPAGQRTLRRRVARAAAEVCRESFLGVNEPGGESQCRSLTIAQAEPRIGTVIAAAERSAGLRLAAATR